MWPNLMILGGGVSKNADKFIPRLTVRCPVVPAQLRNDAGIIGAAIVAAEASHVPRRPSEPCWRPSAGLGAWRGAPRADGRPQVTEPARRRSAAPAYIVAAPPRPDAARSHPEAHDDHADRRSATRPRQMVIGGESVDAADGADVRRRQPGHRRRHRHRAAGRPGGRRPGRGGGPDGVRRPQGLGDLGGRQARPVAGQVRRAASRSTPRSWPSSRAATSASRSPARAARSPAPASCSTTTPAPPTRSSARRSRSRSRGST